MVERLKRWESPRRRGRNDKGKGGSAKARQLRKREKMLRNKLKKNSQQANKPQSGIGRDVIPSLFLCSSILSDDFANISVTFC